MKCWFWIFSKISVNLIYLIQVVLITMKKVQCLAFLGIKKSIIYWLQGISFNNYFIFILIFKIFHKFLLFFYLWKIMHKKKILRWDNCSVGFKNKLSYFWFINWWTMFSKLKYIFVMVNNIKKKIIKIKLKIII